MERKLKQELRDWIYNELSFPDPELGNDVPVCPYAKQAWDKGQVKLVEVDQHDMWDEVHKQVLHFNDDYRVIIVAAEAGDTSYIEHEARCMALNHWFSHISKNIWLLAYLGEEVMVFIQRLDDLDDASMCLSKLGYYDNYDPDRYEELISNRHRAREHNDARQNEKRNGHDA